MNAGTPLKETTSCFLVYGGHSISHSLPIAPAKFSLLEVMLC